MRLRTTLTLAFAAIAALPLFAVLPFALRNLDALLTRQLERRVDVAMTSVRATLGRTALDVRRAMEELADSSALEQVARDARQDPPPPTLATAADALMRPRGLSVLSVFDERGVTLSSGHLPARLGDPDPVLFSVAKLGQAEPTPVQVELRQETGLVQVPALVTARAVDYGDRRVWVVGGVLLDDALSEHLSNLSGAQVKISALVPDVAAPRGPSASALVRTVDFSPAARITLAFSRADLLAAEREVFRAFAVLFGAGLLAAVAVGFLLSRRITRPVEALTRAASQVAQGRLDARVDERASGEVRVLVDAFNQMTADLVRTTERLVASERVAAWREVARRLAHELKNPLTPIRMSLENLLAAKDVEPSRFQALFQESAGVVLEEVERLRRIVDEFSRFARLPKPQLSPSDLAELASSVLKLYRAGSGLTLVSELSPGLAVQADRDQLTQVLLNLVKNAEEAMGGAGRITVRAWRDGTLARLDVEDTGPGIGPEDRARIFEPYFTTKAGGTGLGLAIASRIVQEHGGRLEVTSEPGRGAVFSITLPLGN